MTPENHKKRAEDSFWRKTFATGGMIIFVIGMIFQAGISTNKIVKAEDEIKGIKSKAVTQEVRSQARQDAINEKLANQHGLIKALDERSKNAKDTRKLILDRLEAIGRRIK